MKTLRILLDRANFSQKSTPSVTRFRYRQLSRFNGPLDQKDDNIADEYDDFNLVDPLVFPTFNPPLSHKIFLEARKNILQYDQILFQEMLQPQAVWKLSTQMCEYLHDFFTSPNILQNVAFGILRSNDEHGQEMGKNKCKM